MTEQANAGTWSYRPGSWFGVFGAATTLLLPASEKARVGDLWSRIDDGAGFDDVLDALLQSGLGVLPGFVLIGSGEGPTKILVRGASVRATVTTADDDVVLDGSTVTTWVERTLPDVTALTVTVDGSVDGGDADSDAATDDLPIHGGLVRVGRVDHPPYAAPTPDDDDRVPVAEVEPAVPPAFELDKPAEEPEPDGTELMETVEPDEPAQESSPLDDDGDTSNMGSPVSTPRPSLPLPPGPPSAPAWPSDGPTPPPPPPFAPPGLPPSEMPPEEASDVLPQPLTDPPGEPPPAPPTTVGPGPDHDGLTQAGVDPEEFSRPQPGIPGQPMAPSIGRSVAKLVISNGDTVEVDRVVLVGRAPEARRFTTTDQPVLVTVPSPLHEISSTHVEIRPGSGADHGSAVVTDMGSTNGTVLVQPGLAPEELKPGIAVQLIPGAIINLGDGVTIQVTHP